MHLNKKKNRVEKWLNKNHKKINMTQFEKSINAPKGLIQKFVKYDKPITDKWIIEIHESIIHLIKY